MASRDGESIHARLVDEIVQAINDLKRDAFTDLFTSDIVLDYPYAPNWFVRSVQGRNEVQNALNSVFDRFRRFSLTIDKEYEMDTSIIVEATSDCERKDGEAYGNRYVLIWEFDGDKVCRWTEYFDPQRLQARKGFHRIDETVGK